MVVSNIKASLQSDIQNVWFVEYTKDGYASTFTITGTVLELFWPMNLNI